MNDLEESLLSPTCIFYTTIRFLRLMADIYVFLIATMYFLHIVRSKYLKLKSEGRSFPLLSKIVIGWSLFILFLGLVDSCSIFIVSILEPIDFGTYSIVYEIIEYQRFAWIPIRDFATVSTLLYLFYYQGIVHERDKRAHS